MFLLVAVRKRQVRWIATFDDGVVLVEQVANGVTIALFYKSRGGYVVVC